MDATSEEQVYCRISAYGTHRLRQAAAPVEDEQRSLVIEKRGTPVAVLLSIRDYVRLAAPEPRSAPCHW